MDLLLIMLGYHIGKSIFFVHFATSHALRFTKKKYILGFLIYLVYCGRPLTYRNSRSHWGLIKASRERLSDGSDGSLSTCVLTVEQSQGCSKSHQSSETNCIQLVTYTSYLQLLLNNLYFYLNKLPIITYLNLNKLHRYMQALESRLK